MQTRKLDRAESEQRYYTAGKRPEVVEFGDLRYITLNGRSEPKGTDLQNNIEMLFTLANQIRKMQKEDGNEFEIPKLECQWWTDDGRSFDSTPPDKWNWKLMMLIPGIISRNDVEDAKYQILDRRGMSEIWRVRVQAINEGLCVQAMHSGPYESISGTYDIITGYMAKKGMIINGFYHEIYLSDPEKTDPEKLKTIVRQPVK